MSWFNVTDFWKTVVYGLIAGAGLPALFAIGLSALSRGPRVATAAVGGGTGSDAESSDTVYGGSIIGLIIAAICFLVILAAIGWGIHYIYVAGHPAPKK
ncbi:MAG TPA: hypothetical protein VMU95_30950 [Trebonia sp.]|nr:hypothetical protein [Trebonia sp.]